MKKQSIKIEAEDTIRVTPMLKANEQALKAATARLAARRLRDLLPTKIETKRLILRAPIRGDVPVLVQLANNKNIAEKLARLPSPYTRADGIAFVEIFSQRADERPYAITNPHGDFMGIVGFTFVPGHPPELGYWLGEPFWGKGFMSEAVKALLEAAHATRQFPTIASSALATNAGSLSILAKAGFKIVGDGTNRFNGRGAVKLELEAPR